MPVFSFALYVRFHLYLVNGLNDEQVPMITQILKSHTI